MANSLASFARVFGTPVTDQYFESPPQQLPAPSVQPFGEAKSLADFAKLAQQQSFNAPIAQPDMGAARSRTLDSLGPLLAFVPFFLAARNKKKGLASFARALAESTNRERQAQSALETWKAEQQNKMQQQKYEQAMAQIKDGRSLLEKALALDPGLAGNTAWQNSWLAGDPTFLAESGWKPPVKAEARDKYQLTEVGGRKVWVDPYTREIVGDLGPSGGPKEPKAPARSDVVDAAWRRYYQLIQKGVPAEKAFASLSVDDQALLRRDPAKGGSDLIDMLLAKVMGEPLGPDNGDAGSDVAPNPVPAPVVPAVSTKKQIPRQQYDEMISRAGDDPALIQAIQEKYQPY